MLPSWSGQQVLMASLPITRKPARTSIATTLSVGSSRFNMNISRPARGFTLIELLVVIAIIGILVAISMPVLSNFRGDNLAGGIRQMMGDVARARQLAISQRT